MTLAGEEKMPLPMINPTTKDSPFRYVKLLLRSKLCPPKSNAGVLGVPMEVYPGPEADNGKREALKSNALETEYDLPWRFPRAGDSLKDSLRDEGTPDEEDSTDSRPSSLELARLASSRESRGGRSWALCDVDIAGGGDSERRRRVLSYAFDVCFREDRHRRKFEEYFGGEEVDVA